MKSTVQQFIRDKVSVIADGIPFTILIPPDPTMGDYSINLAFALAKKSNRNPKDVAHEIIEKLNETKEIKEINWKIEESNGFINLKLGNEFLQKELVEISNDQNYGSGNEGNGKKVIVEYSSPNIAKPMHIGHLRSTIIGDALANVYEKLGYDVTRWNYIGDWGTQFGKLIAEAKEEAKESGGRDIYEIYMSDTGTSSRTYIKYHERTKLNPDFEKKAQEEFKKLEQGDPENKILWSKNRQASLEDLNQVYKVLGVTFSIFKGESDYESKLKPLIEELIQKGLAKESEGALIIDLGDMPPMMLRKSDGATLYATRDIASLQDRIENYQPEKILYVVANQQALHFEQLFTVVQKLGWTSAELVHVKFGMVLGEDGKKLATREGKVIPLQEVIDKVTELAHETVQQKNSNLSAEEMKQVAHVVAIGALKYNDLKQHPYSDIEFDWKAMLDLSGNSGPYIQYTYARLANILNKANLASYQLSVISSQLLNESSELRLMRQLLDYPEAITESAERYTLNGLALYLYDLAHRANQFYEQVHVLEDDNTQRRNARLVLIKTVSRMLKDGLGLLGIETLERI